MLFLILVAIWAAVLLPPWLQNRRERRPNDSIVSFRSQMGTLQRATPGGTTMYSAHGPSLRMSRREAQRRRRDVLFTLVGAAGLTLVLATFLGGPVVALHLFVDVLLVGYVALLVNAQQAAEARRVHRVDNVRRLPVAADPAPHPALLLRRTGS